VAPQQLHELGRDEALMADLHRMAERPLAVDLEPAPALDAAVVPLRERQRRLGIARQAREEALDARGIEAEVRRQLPQQRAELAAEAKHARGEEIRERRLELGEPAHVGDVARAFDREDEVVGRRLYPAREVLRPLQRIEGAVDLDGVEPLAHMRELAAVRQALRIEDAAPAGVV